MNSDLKVIEQNYGTKMRLLCEELFPNLLEIEGLLPKLLLNKFEANLSLYEDLVQNNYIDAFKADILNQLAESKTNDMQSERQQKYADIPSHIVEKYPDHVLDSYRNDPTIIDDIEMGCDPFGDFSK